MKRWWYVSFFLLPVLILLAVVAFLGLTDKGLRQSARIAVQLSGGMLTIEEVQGRLGNRWQVHGLRVQTQSFDLSCRKIVVQWQPRVLLDRTLQVVALRGEGVDLLIKEEGKEQGQENASFVLPHIRFPLGIVLDTFELQDVFIHSVSGMELPPVERVSLELTAENDTISLKRVELSIPGTSAHVQGSVALGGKWPLDLKGGWRMEEKDGETLAADFVLSGTVSEQLNAQVDFQTPAKARLNLSCFDPLGDLRWQADADLAPVRLAEVNPDWPELELASADIKASGTMSQYQGTVQLEGRWAQLPQTRMEAELAGDLAGLRLSSLRVHLPEGQLAAQGMLDWQDGLHWQLDIEGENVNPESYFPDWQGRINTRVSSSGRWQGEKFSGEVQLQALDGDLLGYPLSGSGSLTVAEEGVEVKELLLRSGESELSVTGTVGNVLALQVRFDTENLGNILPEAGGKAHLQGSVQGRREAPDVSFELDASMISYEDNVVQALTGSGQGTFTPQGEVNVTFTGEGVEAGAALFTSLSVDLDGTMASHQVQARLAGAAGDMDILLTGGMAAQSWQGEIRDLLLHLDPYGDWQLKSPAPLRIGGKGADLAPVCLEQGQTRVCLQGGWDGGSGEWRFDADIDSFACDLLYQWDLVSLPVEGILAASLRSAGIGTRLVTGEAHLSAPGLQVTVLDEEGQEQLLRWTDTSLTLELADSKLVSVAKTRFQDGNTLDATIAIDQFGDLSSVWEALPIEGKIVLDAKDLSSIALLSDYTVKPTGSMKGTFAVEGRLGNPRLSGELRQIKGNIFIPATGITLEKLLLSVMVKGEEEGEGMHLVLDAVSGPGTIKIVGDLIVEEKGGWQVDAIATGKDFEVANLPDYEILIDPDLRFELSEGVMHVNGKVLVPRAVINIKEFDSSVTASGDVILMDARDEGKKMDPPLFTTLFVELGQDVRIDSFGLKGRLMGGVTVSDAPGLPLSGKGSLTVHEGIFVLKDRPLDISRGRFFFTGGPLENPGIDVLAQKKTKTKTVGVIVSGTVSDMELKLFSDPPMAESQILTELLTGRSVTGGSSQVGTVVGAVVTGIGFEEGGSFLGDITSNLQYQLGLDDIYVEGGESASEMSVMIGKEVFEDLYISYGYDPFSSASIFRARYDLWKGFSVETEVGAEKTGADLLWSIEK